MTNISAIIFAVLAGASTAFEVFINGELGKNTSALIATFISLLVGSLFFLIGILVSGEFKNLVSFSSINPKLLIGGIFGGLIIYFSVKSVPSLGVSNTLTLILVSQILIGFFIDVVILKEITMHIYKYIGVILLAIGTFFIMN